MSLLRLFSPSICSFLAKLCIKVLQLFSSNVLCQVTLLSFFATLCWNDHWLYIPNIFIKNQEEFICSWQNRGSKQNVINSYLLLPIVTSMSAWQWSAIISSWQVSDNGGFWCYSMQNLEWWSARMSSFFFFLIYNIAFIVIQYFQAFCIPDGLCARLRNLPWIFTRPCNIV